MQNGLLFACGGDNTYCYHTSSDHGSIAKHLNTVGADPKDGSFLINDDDGSLANMTLAVDRSFTINKTGIRADGPDYNTFGFMLMRNGTLYTCGGPGSSSDRTEDACRCSLMMARGRCTTPASPKTIRQRLPLHTLLPLTRRTRSTYI